MKLWRIVGIVFGIFLSLTPLLGREYVIVQKGRGPLPFVRPVHPWEVELGIPMFSHKLRIDSAPDIVYEGAVAGIRGGLSLFGPLFFRAELTADFGNLDRRNRSDEVDLYETDFSFQFGSTLGGGAFRMSPYVGLGFHSLLYEDPTGTSVPVEFNYGYFPIGIRWDVLLAPFLEVGFDICLRVMFAGEVKLKYSEVNPSYSDLTDDLKNTVGVRIVIPVAVHILRSPQGPLVSLYISFWYEWQAIESSPSAYVIVINDMMYQNSGALIGVRFYF